MSSTSSRYKVSLEKVGFAGNSNIQEDAYKRNYMKNSFMDSQLSTEEKRCLVSLKLKELQELASRQYIGDEVCDLDRINHLMKKSLRAKDGLQN